MAMNRARRTSNLNNILTYDTLGNSTLIANLTVEGLTGAGFVKADAAGLLSVDTAAYTVVTGATNYLTKITGASTLGQSLVYDNGTSVLVNSTTGVPGYNHAFQVVANAAGGIVVSTTDVASGLGIVNSSSANKTWDISPYGNHLVINESGIATRMKFDAGGNITIGDIVNTGHKLEVVGSFRTTGTNTLSQLQGVGDRMVVANTNGVLTTQPIPTGSITGSGAAGQVNFWTGTNTVSGSNNLFWDNALQRLSITGTNAADNTTLRVSYLNATFSINNASGTYANASLSSTNTGGSVSYGLTNNSSFTGSVILYNSNESNNLFGSLRNNSFAFLNVSATKFYIGNFNASDLIFGTTNLERMRLFAGGNFSIGTSSDLGTRLGVVGDTLLRGSGATSATTALTVQNSSSQNILRILNNGELRVGNGLFLYVFPYSSVYDTIDINGSNFSIYPSQGSISLGGGSQTVTSGNANNVITKGRFFPLSGTATFTDIRCEPLINQTGGANGITRGLYVNPTLTSAADFRAIEWSNNSGWGLYGAGTANNYIAGKLLLNTTTTTNTEQLTVGGNVLLRPTGVAGTFAETSVKFYSASDSGFGAKIFTTDNSGYGIGLGISTRDGATESEKFRVFRNGNTVIQNGGTFTDLGQRLQVMGDTFVRGTGNTNTTNALAVQNSDSVNIFRVRNDATLSIGSFSENPLIYSSDFTGGVSANGASLTFNVQNGTSGSGRYIFTGAAKSSTAVSGNQNLVVYIQSFAPTSGGVSYNVLDVQPTINQIGGANGITRGIYINPVLTAAADFRAIEVSSGVTVLAPSTTTSASLRLPNGVAPTTPTNGDVWSTTTDLLARIGGTTYSLINSGLSGSGTAGQVTYWSSASGLTGSANLFWDNANSRLGIGTNTPTAKLEVTNSELVAIGATSHGELINASQTASAGVGGAIKNGLRIVGSGTFDRNVGTEVYGLNIPAYSGTVYNNNVLGAYIQDRVAIGSFNPVAQAVPSSLTIANAVDYTTYNANANTIFLRHNSGATAGLIAGIYGSTTPVNVQAGVFFTRGANTGSGLIDFVNANSNVAGTLKMRLYGTGNLVIQDGGTFTDAGFRLDVQGTARTTGTHRVGQIFFGTNGQGSYLFPHAGTAAVADQNGLNLTLYNYATSTTPEGSWAFAGELINATSGAHSGIRYQKGFSPPSGTATHTAMEFVHTINQAGGANGITRAIRISPSIVTAADFRAIEWTNNTGWGLCGIGSSINYLNGALLIGSSTNDTVNKLQVTGTIVAGSGTSTNGSVILRGSYTNGYLTTIGTDASSGGPMISYGVESAQNSTEANFVSSTGIIGAPRAAYVVMGNHRWYTAAASTTAIGTAITMTKHMELYNSGNLVLGGGADDATNRLQVGGSIKASGDGRFGTVDTYNGTLTVGLNAHASRLAKIGFLEFTQGSGGTWTGVWVNVNGNNRALQIGVSNSNATDLSAFTVSGGGISAGAGFSSRTTGTIDWAMFEGAGFSPTSGSAIFNQFRINGTINQIGGANGITRGLYIAPTLTAAADWRSIEWSNNTGWGLYGVGTAKNYLNGTTLIGTTTDDGINKLQVAGSIKSAGIVRSDASRTAAINDVSIALLGSNITTYAAGFTMAGAGYGLNAVYAQHEQRFGGNADFDSANLVGAGLMINKLAPTAAGTITMGQVGSGRTMSNLHLMTQFEGNNNLTVTHMSGLHIYGHYRTSGTGTITVSTAYYGILLADPNEFGAGATITGTNWGFYQAGAAPNNYFGGKVLIGTTTTTGTSKLRISGLPTSSAGLGAGEVWNDAGTLKIA